MDEPRTQEQEPEPEHNNVPHRRWKAADRWQALVSRVVIGCVRDPGSSAVSSRSEADDTECWLRAVGAPSAQTYSHLKRHLATCDTQWITVFLQADGIGLLLQALRKLADKEPLTLVDTFLQVELVQCIRAVMNSQTGLDYIVENRDFTRKLASGKSSKSFL